ncbi:MAG TPA: aldo/keto reductase [Anaerolineae bacterium]|nr:aldo/keto reductase [Anaerolineae bacterium]
MKYKQLGNTGLLVSELCFGAMTFGGRGLYEVIGQQGQDAANNLVAQAVEAGVNFFDTANVYSRGQSEQILGQALAKRRHEVIVATKVRGRMTDQPNGAGLSRVHIMDQVNQSLERLGTDYIDLYQIHGFDALTPFDEILRTMDDLVTMGKVRYIGCSNLAAWQLMKAIGRSEQHNWVRFESLQAYYTIAGRDLERELAPLLKDQKLGLMVWSPLAGGLLTDKFHQNQQGPEGARRTTFDFPPVNRDRLPGVLDGLAEVAKNHDCSMAQIALAWLLHQDVVTSVIVGAKNAEQLADNLKAPDITLSEADLARLDEVSALPPEYPGWMIKQQGADRQAS